MPDASGLAWIYSIQILRTPFWDRVFTFLNYFDRIEFFIILIPAIWFGIYWRAGFRLTYLLLINGQINQILKERFASPRPFHLDPSVGMLPISGYGAPSGGAQTSLLLAILLICCWKSPWRWPIGIIYAALISFSRLYLGVHFPVDIVEGWIVAIFLAISFFYLLLPLEKRLEKNPPLLLLTLSQIIPLFLLVLRPFYSSVRDCASLMGIGLGLWLSHFLQIFPRASQTYQEGITRAFLGISGSVFFYFLAARWFVPTPLFLFIEFFLFGLWISFIGHWLCSTLFPAPLDLDDDL